MKLDISAGSRFSILEDKLMVLGISVSLEENTPEVCGVLIKLIFYFRLPVKSTHPDYLILT